MDAPLIQSLITIGAAVVGSQAVGVFVQWFMGRKKNAQDEQRQNERDEIEQERLERDRAQILSAAQKAAQTAALQSANERYDALDSDYQKVHVALDQVSEAAWLLLNVLNDLLMRMKPDGDGSTYTATIQMEELADARKSLTEARRKLR